ncbi:hypothetical protein Tco_0174544 [Tanacetum coccineum]
MTSICDMVGQYMQKKEEEKRIAEEQAAKDQYWKIPICYDDDEDYTIAITAASYTKEPVNSLSMGDEHLDTIPATESDKDQVVQNNSDDIQAAGSDTRPPMLDRTDYESWSQRIRLYFMGKENGLQILQSIDQGPFELGTTRDTLGTTPEGGVLLGPERPRTYEDLSDTEKKRYDADVRATNIVLQGLPKDIYKLINHNIEAKEIWENVKMLLAAVKLNKGLKETNHEQLYAYLKQHEKHAAQDRWIIERITPATNDQIAFVSTVQPHAQSSHVQSHPSSSTNPQSLQYPQFPETSQIDSKYTQTNVQGRQNQNQNPRYAALGNGAAGNGGGAQNRVGNANVAQENGAILDEEELLFLAGEQGNTFDADVDNQPVQDLALNKDNIFQADECDAFDSDVRILENAIDHSVSNQDEHKIHNKVQPSNVIDSTSVHMGNSNLIPYEEYLSVNDISVVPSCASSALNSVCVSPVNDGIVPHDPIAIELKIYKEQVAIYEQRAKFELTERQHQMDDQMRMLIQNHNKTEENLKKELHSFKLQLKSTMENNKILEETVTTLNQEFKQEGPKFPVYDQKTKTALGAQNPFYLRQAKKAQPVLYDGDELLKPHHVPVMVPSSEEELELAEAIGIKCMINDTVQVFWSLESQQTKGRRAKGQCNTPACPTTCDSNETDLRSGEIEWKKLLIANENLVAECLSKDVFFTATDSILNVSRFSDMHDAFTTLESMDINISPNLEVEHFNLQLKYQNLKERFGNKHPVTSSDALSFDSLFVIGKLNEHIQSRCNTIRELKEKISRLTKNNSDTDPTFDLKALVSQNKDLTAKLNALHDLKECFRSDITHKLGLSQLD